MLLALGMQTVSAQAHDSAWLISTYTGLALLDGARGKVDDGPLVGVGVGKFLSSDFRLDLEIERVFSEYDDAPAGVDDSFEINTATLMGRYYFRDSQRWRPFLAAGLGWSDHSGVLSESSNLSITFGLGLGYRWNSRFSSRLQLQYRRDTDSIREAGQNNFNDWLVTVALSYALSGGH